MKCKFNILKDGIEEPWSGSFESEMKAQEWYEKFGKKKEAEGFKLIKVNYVKSTSKKTESKTTLSQKLELKDSRNI